MMTCTLDGVAGTAPARRHSRFLLLSLLGMMLMLPGCEAVAFFGSAVAGQRKIKPQYHLPDRPTLVLVDDYRHQLHDPSLPSFIAAQIGENLKHHRALTQTVEVRRLNELIAQYGDDYRRMGVDQVGKALGAQQVIHVEVEKVTLAEDPGIIQPQAQVAVTVFDVTQAKRLFPDAKLALEGEGSPAPRGHKVLSALPARYQIALETGVTQEDRWHLAERIARDVGRVFHAYRPRQPGEPWEN